MAEPNWYLWPNEDDDDDDDDDKVQNSLAISVRQHHVSIAAGAFQDFVRLQQVHLPLGLQMIGLEAFKRCLALTEINFPSSLIQIQDGAFEGCVSLKEAIFVDGLQLLGSDVFSGCEALTTAILPSTLEFLGTAAFSSCYRLSNVEFFKCEKLEVIPEEAFDNCSGLTHVKLPKSIQVIEESAFASCLRLAYVELPKGLEEIRTNAFSNCATLVSLELPEGLEEMEEFALNSCTSLKNLRLLQPDYFGRIATASSSDDEGKNDDISDDGLPPQNWDRLLEVFDNQSAIQRALYHRFDDFPLHKLCYHQIHYESEEEVMEAFDSIKASDISACSGSRTDLLGMTPLHILALSVKPAHGSLFGNVLEHYPLELVLRKDAWGKNCIDYLKLNKTPYPKPSLLQLASSSKFLMKHVKLDARWTKIQELLEQDLESNPIKNRKRLKAVFYELAQCQKSEIICTLELALWKAALLKHNAPDDEDGNNKRIKMDRQEVRITDCGADVVLSNVLQFMDKIET
ncbi:unnamed protein product [Cylindrotheca closterium]|uniref:Uncharacterized protein n=1 Tax=Cylindrotheca closterium TaxID=2856 RepID=A0AAD2JL90_9STRA|nr:unnamed protein product [Cylindrotheca closterium]